MGNQWSGIFNNKKMNPAKILTKVVPGLAETLNSIHAHLERQLAVQEAIYKHLTGKEMEYKDDESDTERINQEIKDSIENND